MNATAFSTPVPQQGPAAGRLVLVVDDSRVQRHILGASLRRWGYRVAEAGSGTAALEICRTLPVEMVISDWMMPGMTGLELCRAFRALPRKDYGYFILLTSKDSKEETAEGLEIGADDFLSKPVNLHELRARLRSGERVLHMQGELAAKNQMLGETLSKMQAMNTALEHDLEDARRLQQSLVREKEYRFGDFNASLLLRPSGHVGGDLVGVIPLAGSSAVGFFAIDVSGHGIASALMTARLAAYLSGAVPGQNIALKSSTRGPPTLRPPREVAEALNRIVLHDIGTDHYVTLILAWLDTSTGELTMTQAGHPHPVLRSSDGDVRFLGGGGMPVGLLEDAQYDQVHTRLRPGDRLLICSDGIPECAAPDGGMLGDDGLADLMRRNCGLSGQQFFDALTWDLESWAGSADFDDDVSAILIDYRRARKPRRK